MGLDMYLYAETYAGLNYEHRRDSATASFTGALSHVRQDRLSSVTEQVGYWRKANHIHRWFVENAQGGVDDCRRASVSREQLRALRDLVRRVLESCEMIPAPVVSGYRSDPTAAGGWRPIMEDGHTILDHTTAAELLPAAEGFFFGSTAYDQGYVDDLNETLKILDEALACPDSVDFYYQSSW